jgi:copper chaperone CopZ
MKNTLLTITTILALGLAAHAETTVTLTGLHNCCGGCEKGITKAITSVKDVTVEVSDTTAKITAKTKAAADKAVAALLDAGYYGEGAPAQTVADKKVASATVSGTHLCCGKCIKGIDEALKNVSGATGHTATKNAKTITVNGNFNLKDLLAALNKAGYHGKVE